MIFMLWMTWKYDLFIDVGNALACACCVCSWGHVILSLTERTEFTHRLRSEWVSAETLADAITRMYHCHTIFSLVHPIYPTFTAIPPVHNTRFFFFLFFLFKFNCIITFMFHSGTLTRLAITYHPTSRLDMHLL